MGIFSCGGGQAECVSILDIDIEDTVLLILGRIVVSSKTFDCKECRYDSR